MMPDSGDFGVGLIYEDCAWHPVLCTYASEADDELQGISLIDGSFPRSCSPIHCGVVPLRPEQVLWIKANFSKYAEARARGLMPDQITQ